MDIVIIIKIIFFQFFLSLILNKFSIKFDFLDYPDRRKVHSTPTPYIGGLIVAISLVLVVWLKKISLLNIDLIIYFSLLSCVINLIDDKYKISPLKKIFLQLVPVFLIINFISLGDLGRYENIGLISLGSFAKVFTVLSCLLLINAFNYIDGIDGLAASIGCLILLYLGIFSFANNFVIEQNILLFLALPIFIFLFFNLSIKNLPKIFLGNSGSNLISFMIAFLAIDLANYQKIHHALIIWPLAFVVYEFLSTNIIRFINNKNLFNSGNDHIHYELADILKISSNKILLLLVILQIFLSTFGFIMFKLFGSNKSILFFIIFFIIYLFLKFKITKLIKNK